LNTQRSMFPHVMCTRQTNKTSLVLCVLFFYTEACLVDPLERVGVWASVMRNVHTLLLTPVRVQCESGVVKGLCRCRSRHLCGACVQRHCETLGCLQHESGGTEGGQQDGGEDVVCWECAMFARCRPSRVGHKRVRTKPTEEESEKTKVMCCEGAPPPLRAS
jgi:hypothetical protein